MLLLGIFMASTSSSARADENGLFGDWGGIKPSLEAHGISLSLEYKADLVNVHHGALKDGSIYLDNLDFTIQINTEKAGFWKNGTFFVYFISNHGGKPSGDFIGDLQGTNNIEAPSATRLFEAWYEHSFMEHRLCLLVGLHNMNSEFDVSEYGGLFLNSSFGIGPEITGNAAVSVFPAGGLGARIKWQATDRLLLMGAVYDGNPGSEFDNPKGVTIDLNSMDGSMQIVEGQVSWGDSERGCPGTLKIGAWSHSSDFDDVLLTDNAGNPLKHSNDNGAYVVVDQMLYRENGSQGLGAFFQLGAAPKNRNVISDYIGGGLHYLGLIPRRDDDEIGIAVAHAGISDDLCPGMDAAETTWEFTYKAQITPWFTLQPDLQIIKNPGAVPANRDATVGTLRFGVVF